MIIEDVAQYSQERKKTAFFKFKNGKNKIRIVTDLLRMTEYFQNDPNNKPTNKGVCFVVHYEEDGQETLKLAKLPGAIVSYIQSLVEDPDWTGEGTIMPYTITVSAKNAGTKEVVYSPIVSKNKSELSSEMATELKDKDIYETVKKLKEYRDKALAEATQGQSSELPVVQMEVEEEEEEDDNCPF